MQINAHLYLPPASSSSPPRPTDPGCYSIDVLRGYSLLLGSGGVVPELEALVLGLTVGGAAQKRWVGTVWHRGSGGCCW